MTSGQVLLNGISDEEMIVIFQAKEKGGGKFAFTPTNIQIQQGAAVPGQPGKQVYNNIAIHWNSAEGAKLVASLLTELAK